MKDSDGDGWNDEKDRCPDERPNMYSRWNDGCPGPAPFAEKDTPPASGPSCTKQRPCIVLKRKGLSKAQNGKYIDPDATMKVTIARNARGLPARVVGVQLRNVDSMCMQYDANKKYTGYTRGPEVSTKLDPFALKRTRRPYANGGYFTEFRSNPFEAIRTIKGLKYKLIFRLNGDASELMLSISWAHTDSYDDDCSINVYGYNDRLKRTTTAEERAAVARCKEMPTGTKDQRRRRATCLENARF